MSIPRPPRDPADAALALHDLAHRVAHGEVPLPRDGAGPRRVGGRIIVSAAVHAVICGWRVATRWEPEPDCPEVKECSGCGLLRLVDEDLPAPRAVPDEAPLAAVTDLRGRR